MALLYEKSATWRWLVHQSKQSPLHMLAVSGGILAAFYGLGQGVYALQQYYAGDGEERAREFRAEMQRDREAQRYAAHSRRALASMFAQLRNDKGNGSSANEARGRGSAAEGEEEEREEQERVKLPGVAWHPRAK